MNQRIISHKATSRRALLVLSLSMAFCALSGAVHADTSNVTIQGNIQQGTCQFAAGDDNKVVNLGTLPVSSLPASGAATFVPFTLTVENCDAGLTRVDFAFTGTSDSTDPLRFKNTGTATGMAVELESADGVNIGANGTNNMRSVQISGSQAVINLQAALWHLTGMAATAGTVSAVATVNATYN